jgi:hypothetical protein
MPMPDHPRWLIKWPYLNMTSRIDVTVKESKYVQLPCAYQISESGNEPKKVYRARVMRGVIGVVR